MPGRAKLALVVPDLKPVPRGGMGRGAGFKSDTTRRLSGRSVRVLAFGLLFLIPASRMPKLERGAAKQSFQGG